MSYQDLEALLLQLIKLQRSVFSLSVAQMIQSTFRKMEEIAYYESY